LTSDNSNPTSNQASTATGNLANHQLLHSVWIHARSAQLWLRIAPDICLLLLILFLFVIGYRPGSTFEFAARYSLIPTLAILLLVASLSQPPTARRCFSRYFLESVPIRAIGYASYPIYLFQGVILNFYYRLAYDALLHKGKSADPMNDLFWSDSWFGKRNGGMKALGLFLMFVFSYGVQFFYQDIFVARLWVNLQDRVRTIRN